MKKLLSFLLCAVMVLGLSACSEARDPNRYRVDETDEGWCILYHREDDSDEVIARMGDYAQPLVMDHGRLFYVSGSELVSVGPEGGEDVQRVEAGLEGESCIAFMDEDAFYCMESRYDRDCVRVAKDLSSAEKMPVPEEHRQVDYQALRDEIYKAAGAEDRKIRVQDARVELDSSGTVAGMRLHTLTYTGAMGSMPFWNEGEITVRLSTEGAEVSYEDFMVPLSMSDETMNQYLKLRPFLEAVEAIDTGKVALANAVEGAEGFVLVYGLEEWNEAASEGAVLSPDGKAAEERERMMVLGQMGGADEVIGGAGNLVNIVIPEDEA